ncbi:TetR/AcrR family transcriptional regulator [uncultured Tateyamaria sp.]|uniref:TetR/AcrR family transcriptional regulator n=1 Tax=uncultured Tateyamaria sp. TaxID=455651 RepID=UPI0026159B35|nr:TetR/AcrR family transcriptional regulator [uncultured Tateyamaria sp.]
MNKQEDPRLTATRAYALDSALKVLMDEGLLAVTHGAVSKATGISRSTLYRHWPDVSDLRNATFKKATRPKGPTTAKSDGPLRADLTWLLNFLLIALNETPWGQVAPQIIASAATDDEANRVLTDFIGDRLTGVEEVFQAAVKRGEIPASAPIADLAILAVSAPYFRKMIAGLEIDVTWLDTHVTHLCTLAGSDGR